MMQFGKIKLSNRDFTRIVKMYVKFYENHNKCDEICPLCLGPKQSWPKFVDMIKAKKVGRGDCICNVLTMFPSTMRSNCPCHIMGEKAFVALEEMVNKYGPMIGVIPKRK